MADLRDGLLRAIAARIDTGYGWSMVIPGMPWECWAARNRALTAGTPS